MITLLGVCVVANGEEKDQVTVLFTHDLHSHLLPLLDEDGGDFSMGSLFQTAFATSAIELCMMGVMGYDAPRSAITNSIIFPRV